MDSNDKLKEIDIKNRTCYYFDDIFKIDEFNLDNILIDEKLYENILFYSISYKNLIAKPLHVRFDKINGLEFMMDLDIQYYLEVKNMLPFTRRLYIF